MYIHVHVMTIFYLFDIGTPGVYSVCPQVFVTSGLGGMSGAQAKAAVICGCVGVIAEVSRTDRLVGQKHFNEQN